MNEVVIVLITVIVSVALVAFFALGLAAWAGVKLPERLLSGVTAAAFTVSLVSSLAALALSVVSVSDRWEVDLWDWFSVGHYHFRWYLVGDHLSLSFSAFASLLFGLVAAFSRRYLHREAGFSRFYLMLLLFGGGVQIVVLAGSLDLVFIGWELVGVTSALLIAFFHDRPKPVEHGLRAFVTYRFCDIGLLSAVVYLHHACGTTEFVEGVPWDGLPVPPSTASAVVIGLLLLWASMGKSGQVPLGGWLPRAMEGPTPSSAIFYGAISIHLGPYLLLRSAPLLAANPVVAWAVIGVGAVTAIHGSVVGRVQTDIKSALAYASMSQVGLIFVEIGFGLFYIPLIHIVGHATIRSLEILRSPNLLHEHHHLELAVGATSIRAAGHLERLLPESWRRRLYHYAFMRGFADVFFISRFVPAFVRFGTRLDEMSAKLTNRVCGRHREAPEVKS